MSNKDANVGAAGKNPDGASRLTRSKEQILNALTPDAQGDESLNWEVADRAILQYKLTNGDDDGVAELMVLYVETALQHSIPQGDIGDDGFYESIEELFEGVLEHLMDMDRQGKAIEGYARRVGKLVDSTKAIRPSFHDSLRDMFIKAFS